MPPSPPVVLTIAGFDPSSGAGVTADIKTIAAHGCYGISCITAMTVQSTSGVHRVEAVNADILTEILGELAVDFAIASVHIGMLGSGKVAEAVAKFLVAHKLPNIVLDPIVKSSSGADLLDGPGLLVLREQLLPLAAVMTPNVDEAYVLTGQEIRRPGDMKLAADKLHELGAVAVVVTGGHLEKAIDFLSFRVNHDWQEQTFKAERLPSTSTHGTGCAFSTALACHLAQGRALPEAVLLAKTYVAAAIANAQTVGKGTGPVHHLYRMDQKQRRSAAVGAESESAH